MAEDGCYDCSAMEAAYLAAGGTKSVKDVTNDFLLNPTCAVDLEIIEESEPDLMLSVGVPVSVGCIVLVAAVILGVFFARRKIAEKKEAVKSKKEMVRI